MKIECTVEELKELLGFNDDEIITKHYMDGKLVKSVVEPVECTGFVKNIANNIKNK